jgi:hypothetical protein
MLFNSDFVSLVGAQYITLSSRRELCVIRFQRVPRPVQTRPGASRGPAWGAKPFKIRRSPFSLPQLFYNPLLQEPFGSAGNNRLTVRESTHATLLGSTLTRALRKCGKQTPYKSIGIRTCENCVCNLFRIRTYKNGGRGSWTSRHTIRFPAKLACGIIPAHAAVSTPIRARGGFSE